MSAAEQAEKVALAAWFGAAGATMELGHRLTKVGHRWLMNHRRRTGGLVWDAPVAIGRHLSGEDAYYAPLIARKLAVPSPGSERPMGKSNALATFVERG